LIYYWVLLAGGTKQLSDACGGVAGGGAFSVWWLTQVEQRQANLFRVQQVSRHSHVLRQRAK